MGKCVRMIRGSSKAPPATAAASCLTLRSGRRVLPSACSPRTSRRPRRYRSGSARRWCGAEAAKKESACGSHRRRGTADAVSPQEQLCDGDRLEAAEVMMPSQSQAAYTGTAAAVAPRGANGCGDSFERPKTPPLMMTTDDCDAAAVVKAKAEHDDNESHRCRAVVAGQTPSPPPLPPTEAEMEEAEMEAFFAVAELAERRRFAEAYNYDVALDRPLEGRFEWTPVGGW